MPDIEVSLEDEKTVKKTEKDSEEIIVESKEEAPDKGIKVEDAIAELKNRLQEEQNARAEAEKRAREAEYTASVAKSEVEDSNLHLITGAIETLKRDSNILKSNYKSALASGNYEEAANINERMNAVNNKLLRLEEGKVELEKRPKVEVKQPPRHSDVVEEFASRLSPRSAEWIRKHPECVTDVGMNQVMIGAHTMALGKRITVDTPEYFSFIENALGISGGSEGPSRDSSEPTQQSTGGRQAAPVSAPVSRTASSSGSNRPNVVRLSEAEREVADSMGMTYQEYAKNKVALQKSGKIN